MLRYGWLAVIERSRVSPRVAIIGGSSHQRGNIISNVTPFSMSERSSGPRTAVLEAFLDRNGSSTLALWGKSAEALWKYYFLVKESNKQRVGH